jgi:hypothetical protein
LIIAIVYDKEGPSTSTGKVSQISHTIARLQVSPR